MSNLDDIQCLNSHLNWWSLSGRYCHDYLPWLSRWCSTNRIGSILCHVAQGGLTLVTVACSWYWHFCLNVCDKLCRYDYGFRVWKL